VLIILLFHHLEHFDSLRERHADRLNSWMGCRLHLLVKPECIHVVAALRECACCRIFSHDDYVLYNSGRNNLVRLAVCLHRYVYMGRVNFLVKVLS